MALSKKKKRGVLFGYFSVCKLLRVSASPVLLDLVIRSITIYEIGIKWLIGGTETTRD